MYYRLTRMGRHWYASKFHRLEEEFDDIQALVDDGDNVLIVNDLNDAASVLDIDRNKIIVVEPE